MCVCAYACLATISLVLFMVFVRQSHDVDRRVGACVATCMCVVTTRHTCKVFSFCKKNVIGFGNNEFNTLLRDD